MTSVLLCFIFMWKNSFLELLGGRTYDGFFFKFIELSLLLSFSPQCGSLFSDTSCLCSPHLLLPGSVLSFVSIPPILFDFDPLPAVFPPGEEAWDQSWKFAEISCFSPFRSTALAPADLAVGPLLTQSRLRQKPLLGLAAVLQLALSVSCVCWFCYFWAFPVLRPTILVLPSASAHTDTTQVLWMVVVRLHLLVFCC